MAQLLDHIEYLSKEIGPRPAGTEEEQEAALYIADKFQQEAGFHADIEEFTSSSNLEGARAVPSGAIIVVTLLAMIFNAFTIPALILTLLVAAVYVLEAFDHNIISKFLARGASQNVVAKYQPKGDTSSAKGRGRSRKVVLVAHYDTGKVKPALLQKIDATGLPVGMICIAAMALTALLLLVRIFVGGAGGPGVVVLNVLSIIALIVVALPVVKAVMYRLAPYNEGANNNATGTAALIEVARRISQGSVSEAELAAFDDLAAFEYEHIVGSQNVVDDGVVIHGEAAALESGLVPEGVTITYETDQPTAFAEPGKVLAAGEGSEVLDERDERERLLAAKAAIAALTGRPVVQEVYVEEFVQEEPKLTPYDAEPAQYDVPFAQEEPPAEVISLGESPVVEEAVEPAPQFVSSTPVIQPAQQSSDVAGFQNAPSWFVAAQQNAKKSSTEPTEVQRSRYNQALDNAEREMAQRELERAEEERRQKEAAALEALKPVQVAPPTALEDSPASDQANIEEGIQKDPAIADAPIVAVSETAEAIDQNVEPLEQEHELPVDAQEEPVEQEPQGEPEADLGQTVAWQPIKFQPEDIPEIAGEEEQGKVPQLDLPQIDAVAEEPTKESAPETSSPSRSGLMRKLRTDIPSLSGVIRTQQEEESGERAAKRDMVSVPEITLPEVSTDNSSDVDYDMDLSSIRELDIEAPAEATPGQNTSAGQVNMPSSRADGFLGRRRGKNEELSETPQEWLDVDADFDARTVGRERGSWESFRDDATQASDASKSSRKWEGGAFSRLRLGHVDTRSGVDATSDEPEETVESEENRILNEEIGQIIHFRNPDYNTEIWFVAIGSDTELHDGAKAFIDAHANELKGSMVIEIESLGAGALSYATEEGQYRKTTASSRVKRYVRPASEATGIALDGVKLNGADSVTTTMQKAGYQAMHLFGAEGGAPALKGSADDVFENVEELTLEENVAFLMELLKRN